MSTPLRNISTAHICRVFETLEVARYKRRNPDSRSIGMKVGIRPNVIDGPSVTEECVALGSPTAHHDPPDSSFYMSIETWSRRVLRPPSCAPTVL